MIMKKVLFVLVTLMAFCSAIDSQWYYRRYGVASIDKLSTEQLNESLAKARNGVTGCIVISAAGVIGICAGGYFIAHSKKVYPEANDLTNLQMTGATLILLSVPLEIIGLTKLGISSSRKKVLREEAGRRGLKPGIALYQQGRIYASCRDHIVPVISIRFDF